MGSQYFISYAEFNYLREHSKTAQIAGIAEAMLSWKPAAESTIRGQLVSENLLPMIGARPRLGRLFTREDMAKPGSAPVVVLSHAAWQRYFGGTQDVIGKTMLMNRTLFTIVGVADEQTRGPLVRLPDLWIPYTMQNAARPGEPFIEDPNTGWIQVFARPQTSASDRDVKAEMAVLAQQALDQSGGKRKARVSTPTATFLNAPNIVQDATPVAAILFLAVSLVLLVACSNVGNLLLARGLARQREIAIRLSIGAGRGRLLQQLLTESVLLSLFGGVLGLVLAQGVWRVLLTFLPAGEFGPNQLDFSPDASILAFTVALSAGTGLLFGLVPAWHTLLVDLTPALKAEGAEVRAAGRRLVMRNALVGLQVAVCLVLLVNASLLLRGFRRAIRMDLGQATKRVLVANFDLRQQLYRPEQATRFFTTLLANLEKVPGVQEASTGQIDPFVSFWYAEASLVDGHGQPGIAFPIGCNAVGADYFKVMNIPLRMGRAFTAADLSAKRHVAVIDERLSSTHFSGRNPLGERLRVGETEADDYEIVGVAANTQTPRQNEDPMVYQAADELLSAKLLVRIAGPAEPVKAEIGRAVAALDPNVAVRVKRIEDNVDEAVTGVKLGALFASALGTVALLLACAGIYALVSFAVTRRRREVGIRMALGAEPRTVMTLMVWQGLKPVLAGALIGIALGAGAARLIRAMLYGVSSVDPLSFGTTAVLLVGAATLAAWVPARSALRVDPSVTLRHE